MIYRIHSSLGSFCLKAVPATGMTSERLDWIHGLMRAARRKGLQFVPAVVPGLSGDSVLEAGNCLWELTEWMPGKADYHASPSAERLRAACEAMAELHVA